MNTKCADQPEHPLRLNSVFVIQCLGSIISKLATSEISVAEEAGLSLVSSETSKTGFVGQSYTE